MLNKRLVLIAAMLLAAVIVAAGAAQIAGVNVPQGEIVDSPNANTQPQVTRQQASDAPALPPATGQVLFSEDFAGNNLDNWRSLDSTGAKWTVKEGRLQQAGDVDGNSSDDRTYLVTKDATFSDGVFEAYTYATSGEPVGLVFRGSDAGNYRLVIHTETPGSGSKLLLERVTGTVTEEIASAPVSAWAGYAPGRWHHVAVNAVGPAITISVDGKELISANDSTHSAGWAGLWSVADMSSQFDNIRIQHTAGR